MFSTPTLMVLVPALPLAASLITAALGKRVLREQSHLPTIVALVLSFVLSMFLLFDVRAAAQRAEQPATGGAAAQPAAVGVELFHTLWTWAVVEGAAVDDAYAAGSHSDAAAGQVSRRTSGDRDFRVDVTLRADPLTAVMLAMVTFVSSLVAIYSAGYMRGDPGYWRFFSYVSLFVFSMTMLVSVSNFVLLYVFWEAVGVCSYLLIGFWYEKPEAAAAGKKAFLVNRVGDFGFALGLFLLWTTYGTLNFHDADRVGRPVALGAEVASGSEVAVEGVLGQSRLAASGLNYVGGTVGLAICLCLLAGACGKSAQFPLHVWLPDAMEGPTPVSALIHAATMVTAGVYLVARCAPLFAAAPEARLAVAAVGCFTGLLAGIVAMTQNDLKRVLAWSTISQLGYMFLGLGTGTLAGITAGMFHLFTHAFFKALLFLGAGSVMHAMGGVIDIQRLGGLRRLLPWTHLTFWCGCLALAGVVPFAGFWSKDAILAAVHERSGAAADYAAFYQVLYFAALFTAFLTAVYTFRALFLTFFGPLRIPPEAGHHAHESPPVMLVPLVVLAAGSLLVGAWFEWTHGFADFLAQTPSLAYREIEHAAHGSHWQVALLSTLIAVSGVALAAFLYLGDRRRVELLAGLASSPYALRLYQLSSGRFYFDQIYQVLVVWPLWLVAQVAYWLDRWLVDGLVNASGRLPWGMGSVLRALQNGLVPFYALAMMLGLLVLIGTLLWWPGL